MRTFFAIAISTFIPVHAFAGDMRPMSIDDMKAAIIGNSMSGRPKPVTAIPSTTRPMAASSACRGLPANTKGRGRSARMA